MITEDQSAVVSFLSSPTAPSGAAVERIDTHASIVFLAGERAWKLKRAVKYDYLDYSTADRRRCMCESEVRINRRTAPALYRGVTAVTRQADGSLAIGGAGTPVDWLVEMARFDQGGLLDQLAESSALPLSLMGPLAHAIARFHGTAECRLYHGGWDAMRRVIDGNVAGFRDDGGGVLDPVKCDALAKRARLALDRSSALLDQRREDGRVRHCHGDLHLRNIVLSDNQPTLFDAIEFNDEIASIDVLYDLAFVLMDLWRRGLRRHANALWNGYLAETGDLNGLPLMPLFLSCRAAVMAKTTATSAKLQDDAERRLELQARANEYLTMAADLLEPSPPSLIAVGGLSGSGKSTLAAALAPSTGAPPGAVVIRTDEIRKKQHGVKALDRLGQAAYSDEASRPVYATLMEQANKVVRGGYVSIADAVFVRSADRIAIEHVAHAAGTPFVGLWLEAPEQVLISRVEGRGPEVSDAGIDVVRQQLTYRLDSIRWHRLDASGTHEQVGDEARKLIHDLSSATRSPESTADAADARPLTV